MILVLGLNLNGKLSVQRREEAGWLSREVDAGEIAEDEYRVLKDSFGARTKVE